MRLPAAIFMANGAASDLVVDDEDGEEDGEDSVEEDVQEDGDAGVMDEADADEEEDVLFA